MKLLNFLFLLFFSLNLFGSDINITDEKNYFRVTDKKVSEFSFINSISNISTTIVKSEDRDFIKLNIPSYSSNSSIGDAEIPVLQKLIRVPLGSDIVIKIINSEEEIINLSDFGYNIPIFPNQPSVSKSAVDFPFFINDEYYDINQFLGNEVVETRILGKMRGQQLARIYISPIKYNPFTNQLKIITKMEVKIIFKNINIPLDNENRNKYYSSDFETLFKTCINYTKISEKDVITTYPIKYVIISDPIYQSTLQPFIE